MEQQYLEETLMQNNNSLEEKFYLDNHQTYVSDADDGASNGFDCNICLDSVQDPVVTLCGHLFCWPCIYKWLHYNNSSAQPQCQPDECRCPVCKAEISHTTLVPLYGRFQTTNPNKTITSSNLGPAIPRRPLGPACGAEAPSSPSPQLHPHNYSPSPSHSYYPRTHDYIASSLLNSSSITTNTIHPLIGMMGEAIYARAFGNPTTNLYTHPNSYGHLSNSSARLRRHIMQADESLSRICFFFFCCVVLCFLLF